MKVCIYGAGAIGGLIGAKLAQAGHCETSAMARGATLASLQRHGWRLRHEGQLQTAPVQASSDARTLGVQDLVVIAVKGPAMAAVAENIGPLIGADTIVLPAVNGVPWWFAQGLPGLGNEPLASVDPGGRIAIAIPTRHVLGCVVHASAASPEPGLVDHKMGRGLIVGEPSGGESERAQRVVALLQQAGFEATLSGDIRQAIWYKLWGNLTINPISALTGAKVDQILDDPLLRRFCSVAMTEAAEIGRHIGCAIAQTPEDRHQITRKLGSFKTSMLQDVEAGRPIELDAIVTAVHEIAQRLGVATPNIDVLLGLTRLFAQVRGSSPS